jgi:hypothetical protein
MPINPMQFEIQESPFGKGLAQAIANRLAQAQAQTAENEAPYAGLAKQAQAASQFAYSHFMQPQYASKLAGNQQFMEKLTPDQQQAYLNFVNQQTPGAGGIQAPGNGQQWNNPALDPSRVQQGGGGVLGGLGQLGSDIFHKVFGGGMPPQTQPQQPSQLRTGLQNYLAPPSQQQQAPVSNAVREEAGMPGSSVTKDVPAVQAAPLPDPTAGMTPIERQAYNEGTLKKSGAKSTAEGTTEGQQTGEYGKEYSGLIGQGRVLDSLAKGYQDPIFKDKLNTPFVNAKAIKFYKNTESPEFQEKLAKLETTQNTLISASIKDFGSRMTDKDLGFLRTLKANDDDLLAARVGKVEGLKIFNEAKSQQIKLAHQYMKQGMDQFDAEDKARQEVNMDKIEEDVAKQVNPSSRKISRENITAENLQHTAKQMGISVPEVIKRLQKKGIEIPEGAL